MQLWVGFVLALGDFPCFPSQPATSSQSGLLEIGNGGQDLQILQRDEERNIWPPAPVPPEPSTDAPITAPSSLYNSPFPTQILKESCMTSQTLTPEHTRTRTCM